MRFSLVFLAVVSLSACKAAADAQQTPPVDTVVALSDSMQSGSRIMVDPGANRDSLSALDMFIVGGLRRLGDSRAHFVARLGQRTVAALRVLSSRTTSTNGCIDNRKRAGSLSTAGALLIGSTT